LADGSKTDPGDPNPDVTRSSDAASENSRTDPVESVADAAAPPPVPGYEVLGELGRGGMGVVYKARQLGLNRVVALKMILAGGHAGEAALVRFRQEAEAVARLQHPGIVQVYETGTHDGLPYFSLEFVGGETLGRRLAAGPLPAREAARLVADLSAAVQYAHTQGIVHRDLKPANVLLTREGAPKVTDFGLAKTLDTGAGQTRSGEVIGTPSYMAPEQARGKSKEIGPLCDVYALRAILYECLTGRPPFQAATTIDTILQVTSQEPVAPRQLQPQLPRDLDTVTLKCLQKDPRRRYASVAALADDLGRFLRGEPIAARPVGAAERAWRWCRRNPAVAALAAGVAVSLVAGIAVAAYFAVIADRRAALAEQSAQNERDARGEADDARHKADDNAAKANTERQVSDRLRDLARDQLDGANRRVYVGDIRAAQRAAEQGRLARMLQFLELHHPQPRQPDPRGWEWYYLRGLAYGGGPVLRGHLSYADALAWSPDGSRLASASSEFPSRGLPLRIWDAANGQEAVTCPGANGGVTALAWAPDGRTLASASEPGAVQLLDTARGEVLRTLEGHTGRVFALAFSPDGKRLATAGADKLVVWNVADGAVVFARDVRASVRRVAWNHDGSRLASGDDAAVRVWDAAGAPVRRLVLARGQRRPEFAWLPDGDGLAWEESATSIQVVDVASGTVRATCSGHASGADGLAVSRDGKYLAASGAGLLRVWATGTGGSPAFTTAGERPAWGPGALLAVTLPDDDAVCVFDVSRRALTRRLDGHLAPVYALAWSPTKPQLASAGADGTVRLWDAAEPSPAAAALPDLPGLRALAWRPDCGRLALGVGDGTVHIWDPESRKLVGKLTTGVVLTGPEAVGWSPDGKSLAVVGGEWPRGTVAVTVWDVASGVKQRDLPVDRQQSANRVRWSPDGKYLAVDRFWKVEVWDVAAGKQAAELDCPEVSALAWSGNSDRLAVGGRNVTRALRLSTAKADSWWQLKGPSALALSPDGRSMAAGVWDPVSRVGGVEFGALEGSARSVRSLEGHTTPVQALAWSPDGQRVVSVAGGETKVWDPAVGAEVLTLAAPAHRPGPLAVAWHPDGRLIAVADAASARFWDARRGYQHAGRLPSNFPLVTFRPAAPPPPATPPAERGFVRSWRFAPDTEPWPDEREFVDLSPEKLRAIGAAASSAPLATSPEAFVDLLARWPEARQRAAYALRTVVAKGPRKVKLLAGSDDALRVWVNGRPVLETLRARMAVPDEDSAVVELRPGDNRLLVEVSQVSGAWGFFLRIADEAGRPLYLNEDGTLAAADETK
jgi:WD40 repeat protein